MRRPLTMALALGFSAASWTTTAFADVIHDMPISCPRGTEKHQSHNGPYCVPPMRADCPAGYVPKVRHSTSYCEAPPPAPCPKGLHWDSDGPDKASCGLNYSCDKVGDACDNGQCERLSFCIEHRPTHRHIIQVAHGTCRTQADCAGTPGTTCEKRLTCTNSASRKNEAARIEAAKNVPASAVPAPYVASPMGGDPPRYRILKDGQSLPALPDVPEPPDDTPNTPPAPETPEDAGTAPTPADPGPGDTKPVDVPQASPQPPKSGGCAGCEVGGSDDDMVGWAALMCLLGVGIALRRKGGG
ncbi:hypothetical protein [Polyangium sp. 15x6]|uniref:hypothetical protein n=1 Tax=Polyangium sp. 15x6 TaxID=3042687 RepID=UPI00249A07CA|nr:hypothetical protein [Polyangium sp. 15x6]MDI3283461.1 hypothetical protein [Polyangium sp. 15x6]